MIMSQSATDHLASTVEHAFVRECLCLGGGRPPSPLPPAAPPLRAGTCDR